MKKYSTMRALFLVLCILCLYMRLAAQELPVPDLHQYVTDQTGTLPGGDIDEMNSQLAAFQQQTSNQIVVLMIPSLQGEALEDFSVRVAEKNKMGKKDRNNGVLLLVVKDDHKVRIEVGYGLEGALTDALTSQIIRNDMIPHFRSDDYAGGLRAGIDALERASKGEYQGDEQKPRQRGVRLPSMLILIVFAFLSFIFRMFGGRRHYVGSRGYYTRGPWGGGFGGGMGGGFGGGFGGGGGGGFSGGGGSFGGGGSSGSW